MAAAAYRVIVQFNRNKNPENHDLLKNRKERYKLQERKLKRQYKQNEENMLGYLKKYNPNQFYSMFGGKNKNTKPLLTLTQLYVHFKDLNINDDANNDTANTDDVDTTTDGEHSIYDELDNSFTEQDIVQAINNPKKGKVHGLDGILNECFIEGGNYLAPLFVRMFNHSFN